jgi:hypothetical protein
MQFNYVTRLQCIVTSVSFAIITGSEMLYEYFRGVHTYVSECTLSQFVLVIGCDANSLQLKIYFYYK